MALLYGCVMQLAWCGERLTISSPDRKRKMTCRSAVFSIRDSLVLALVVHEEIRVLLLECADLGPVAD
jgi:hypothetical protein